MCVSKPRKLPQGKSNIVVEKIVQLRAERNLRQKDLVAMLQSPGIDISDTSMSRPEGQTRQVCDYELPILAEALNVSVNRLPGIEPEDKN